MWYYLRTLLYKVVLPFKSEEKTPCVTIQIQATKQYAHVVPFIMPHKMVLV